MINNDRIVPVVRTDLLTLGTMFKIAGTTIAAAESSAVRRIHSCFSKRQLHR